MPNPVTGVLGAVSVGGSLLQSRAASRATRAQTQAADASIAEQRRQFDAAQQLLQPYVAAGTPALKGLMDLAGLSPVQTNWTAYAQSNPELMAAYQQQVSPAMQGGAGVPYGIGEGISRYNPAYGDIFIDPNMAGLDPGAGRWNVGYGDWVGQNQPMSLEQFAQQWHAQRGGDISQFQDNPQARAVAQLEEQPMFQALARQGEEAILQNASATGGLRGGNAQGALARFRPQLLNQFINQQFARLSGITEMGQNSAAGVGSAGLATGANIGSLMMQQGQAQAAGAGAQGQIFGNLAGGLGGLIAGGIRPGGPSAGLLPSVGQAMQQNPRLF